MKLCRLLFAGCASLSASLVVAATSPPAVDLNSLDPWVRDTLALAESLESGVSQQVQEAIYGALEQIRTTEDTVLRTVWEDLFKLGSTLHANFSAWKKLEAFDYEKHIDGKTLKVDDPVAKKALSEAVLDCSSLELLVLKQVTELRHSFDTAVREQSASNDRRKSDSKYLPMRRFLHQLESYMSLLQGQTQLIHRKGMLEAAVSKGDAAAQSLLRNLEEQLHRFYEALEKQFSRVLRAARRCQELGLLLDGVVAFMSALNEL